MKTKHRDRHTAHNTLERSSLTSYRVDFVHSPGCVADFRFPFFFLFSFFFSFFPFFLFVLGGFKFLFLFAFSPPHLFHILPNSPWYFILYILPCSNRKSPTPALFSLFALDHMILFAFTCIILDINSGDITLMSLATAIIPRWPMLWESDPSSNYPWTESTGLSTGPNAGSDRFCSDIPYLVNHTTCGLLTADFLMLLLAYIHFYPSSPTSL